VLQYTSEVDELIDETQHWRLLELRQIYRKPINHEDWKTLDLTYASDVWYFFGNLSGSRLAHESDHLSPLKHAKLELWRQFGFAIWSTERMASYGLLLSLDICAVGMEVPYYEAWKSLLTQHQKDAVDEENKKQEILSNLPKRPSKVPSTTSLRN
jgi:hypothetical protein